MFEQNEEGMKTANLISQQVADIDNQNDFY